MPFKINDLPAWSRRTIPHVYPKGPPLEVLSVIPQHGLGNVLAVACVQITPEIRVNGLRLVRAGNGDLRVFSPNAGGKSVLSFAPTAVAELKSIIIDAYRSENAHDRSQAA